MLVMTLLAACSSAPSYSSAPLSEPMRFRDPGLAREINRLRSDPQAYADRIEQIALAFEPGPSCRADDACVLTMAGELQHTMRDAAGFKTSITEAARELRSQPSLPQLASSYVLAAAAYDHTVELSDGDMSNPHQSHDGGWPRERIERRGPVSGKVAENIMFGFNTAFGIVASWLIDYGVSDRGHRVNLLDPDLRYIGSACGAHPRYRIVCVTEFARYAGY
ncbi:MAG: CAP domain-containing protein [Alphaproteobacteria bacterium]